MSKEEEEQGAKALTNEDFRKILFTPRPGAKPDLAQQRKQQQKPRPRQPPPQFKPRKKSQGDNADGNDDEEDKEEGPSYRDRAAERRMGLGPEIVGAAAAAADLDQFSYEQSKYLGGDMDHTHLVKGLDYALLSKVRSEQRDEDTGAALPRSSELKFNGPLGRAVYNILFSRQQIIRGVDASERFLPRRTAFVFNLKGKDPFEVPTTLLRAKEDCPAPPRVLEANSDAAILDRLAKIMAYMSMGSGGRRKKDLKKEQVELQEKPNKDKDDDDVEPINNKPVDEDEDIFADAGTDYVAERRATTNKKPVAQIFNDSGRKELDAEDLPPIAQPMATEAAAANDDDKAKAAKRKAMLESIDDDGYAECYPSYYDAAGAIYDSEDDDGAGAAAAAKEDDEEATKKKEAAKQRMKEKHKEESELAKLQKVFEEKGYGNQQAFGAKKNSDSDAATMSIQKRRRI